MPGPVSDSPHPEFGTTSNAADVYDAIDEIWITVTQAIGSDKLQNIVQLARAEDGPVRAIYFSKRQLRIIRFCLNRAKEVQI